MKKKLCAQKVVAIIFLALFASFAQATNWEFSVSYENTFKNSDTLEVDNDDITYLGLSEFNRTTKAPIGGKATLITFLGSPFTFTDFGVGVDGSMSKFTTYTFSDFDATGNSGIPDLDIDLDSGVEYNVGFGPVLRLNFGRRHSFSFFPSAMFTLRRSQFTKPDQWGVADDPVTVKLEERNLGYNFNISYRCWLIAKQNFLMGLNLGLDLQSVQYSHSHMNYGGTRFNYETDDQTTAKVYIGISINIGKRGVDRAIEQRKAEDAENEKKPSSSKTSKKEK